MGQIFSVGQIPPPPHVVWYCPAEIMKAFLQKGQKLLSFNFNMAFVDITLSCVY